MENRLGSESESNQPGLVEFLTRIGPLDFLGISNGIESMRKQLAGGEEIVWYPGLPEEFEEIVLDDPSLASATLVARQGGNGIEIVFAEGDNTSTYSYDDAIQLLPALLQAEMPEA